MTVPQSVKEGPPPPTKCKRPPEPIEVFTTRCTPGGGNERKRSYHYVIVYTYDKSLYFKRYVEYSTAYKYDNITHKVLNWSCVESNQCRLSNRRGFILKGKGGYITNHPTPSNWNKGDPLPPHKKGAGTQHYSQNFAKEKFFYIMSTEAKEQGGQKEGRPPCGSPPLPPREGDSMNTKTYP